MGQLVKNVWIGNCSINTSIFQDERDRERGGGVREDGGVAGGICKGVVSLLVR